MYESWKLNTQLTKVNLTPCIQGVQLFLQRVVDGSERGVDVSHRQDELQLQQELEQVHDEERQVDEVYSPWK